MFIINPKKAIIILLFSLQSIQYANCQCAPVFGFYTIRTNTRELCFVDTTGNLNIIGQTGLPDSMVIYHSMDFDRNGNLWFASDDTLYLINTETGRSQVTKLTTGITQTNGEVLGISFNSNNELYVQFEVSDMPPGTVYKINSFVKGEATPLSNNTGIASILGIEFDDNDTLWALDECCINKLHKIDTSTGQAMPNNFPGHDLGDPADLDYSNGTLYGLTLADNPVFFRINTLTGQSHPMFSLNERYMGIAGSWKNINIINDTATTELFDTTFVTVYDTLSVTDTLIINAVLTDSNVNIIKVYPNPTNDYITIDYGNFKLMVDYSLKIANFLGQEVYVTGIKQKTDYLNLSDFGTKGVFFVSIFNSTGEKVVTKKIILK